MSYLNSNEITEWFNTHLEQANNDPEAYAYGIILRIVAQFQVKLHDNNWTMDDLAAKLNWPLPKLERIFSVDGIIEFKDLVEIASALEYKLDLFFA